MFGKSQSFTCFVLVLASAAIATADDSAATKRRQSLMQSYGTYGAGLRTPDGHIDSERLLADLGELHANTYNFLIARADTNWDDLHKFLPLAHKQGIRVWVTLLPPSESPPRSKRYSEPYRLDFVKWATELSALSAREPALVAWSVDDFAYNLKLFTLDYMRKVIAAQREKNPNFAFAPCIYYKHANPTFAKRYREFFDGILFPYRSESTKAGLTDATQVESEIKTLRSRFGPDFPIVVDIYATAHSSLGASTPQYVEQLMQLAYPIADGVHIYRHQDKRNAKEREKYEIVQHVMSTWATDKKPAKPAAKE